MKKFILFILKTIRMFFSSIFIILFSFAFTLTIFMSSGYYFYKKINQETVELQKVWTTIDKTYQSNISYLKEKEIKDSTLSNLLLKIDNANTNNEKVKLYSQLNFFLNNQKDTTFKNVDTLVKEYNLKIKEFENNKNKLNYKIYCKIFGCKNYTTFD